MANDPEGETVLIKSFTQPASSLVEVSLSSGSEADGDERIVIKTLANSEGVHEFDAVVTDGTNDVV
ncbi:hypothetical protein, partial [Shewanella colwelliana]|uniref:hypothetical protein n=1 Tax=Shewanella colwelliana TaxID=23 RepID=UPI001C7CFB96